MRSVSKPGLFKSKPMTINIFDRTRNRTLRVGLLMAASCLAAFSQTPAQVTQGQADSEYQAGAVLWTQSSGERAALSYQTFTLARMMLDRDLRTNRGTHLPRAVVVDVDETVLDNSRYQAMLVKDRQKYESPTWTDWCNRVEATALPGAVEFLRYANSRGVRVFYITNRKDALKPCTASNLKKLGFPNVNDQTLLVQTDPNTSTKEPRRLSISAKFHIVLLMGDNLNDFAEVFEKSKTIESRLQAVEKNRKQFGTRFIVLPNPMYGDWESAIYGYNLKLTEPEKAAKRSSQLKVY
jgi:5'-nucleotidase (lipoprotein e(P4) family)